MRNSTFIPVAGAVGLLMGMTGTAFAQELTEEQRQEAIAFADANTTFVLPHEVGHMLVDQMRIPILGREEDAVDNLATLLLLWRETPETDAVLIDAAYGWFLSDASQTSDFQASDFYDEHSLDLQRGYSIICKMVGSDPDGFADLANEAEIEPERQENCGADFEQAHNSWLAVLEPHLRAESGEPRITVVHEESTDEGIEFAVDLLKNMDIMNNVATMVDAEFTLPNPITFRAAACGEPNAFYDPSVPEVVMCYEIVALFADLIVEDIFSQQ